MFGHVDLADVKLQNVEGNGLMCGVMYYWT